MSAGGSSVALKCPSCAGPLSVREGDTHTVCPSCGSSLLMSGAVRRYVLPENVGGTAALRSVRRELEKGDRKLLPSTRVKHPMLYYVPFWHCTAQVNGYVLGVEPEYKEKKVAVVTDSEGGGPSGYAVTPTRTVRTRTGSKAVEREIQISGSVNVSGADLEPLGIPSLSADAQLALSGMDIQRNELPEGLEVLEDESGREGVFVDPVVPLTEARRQTASYLGRLGSGIGSGLEQRWDYVVITGHRDSLVYYPLWVVGFQTRGRDYQAVVDGRSGSVLRGRFPGSARDRGILSAATAALWAGVLPFATDALLSWDMAYTNADGERRSCLPAFLIAIGALGYGTYRFMGILDGLRGSGSDRVV